MRTGGRRCWRSRGGKDDPGTSGQHVSRRGGGVVTIVAQRCPKCQKRRGQAGKAGCQCDFCPCCGTDMDPCGCGNPSGCQECHCLDMLLEIGRRGISTRERAQLLVVEQVNTLSSRYFDSAVGWPTTRNGRPRPAGPDVVQRVVIALDPTARDADVERLVPSARRLARRLARLRPDVAPRTGHQLSYMFRNAEREGWSAKRLGDAVRKRLVTFGGSPVCDAMVRGLVSRGSGRMTADERVGDIRRAIELCRSQDEDVRSQGEIELRDLLRDRVIWEALARETQ